MGKLKKTLKHYMDKLKKIIKKKFFFKTKENEMFQ